MTRESTTLYYREGTSDKVYQAAVEEQNGGFIVTFGFGRRGSTLQTGAKTAAPVPYQEAKRLYDRLIGEKTAKGYTPGPEGTPYSLGSNEDRTTGILPQLLNTVDATEVERLIRDPKWWLQEKKDGKRVLIRKLDGVVSGINRKGLTIGLPEPVQCEAEALPGDYVLDGEAVGDRYFVFDCLNRHGKSLVNEPLRERWRALVCFVPKGQAIQIVPTAGDSGNKREMYTLLQQDRREGAVFKRTDAPYVPGRPASGGTWLKHKFTSTCSAIVVAGRNGKRSVGLELLNHGRRVPVGNVTIPPNAVVPQPGAVIEVRYLYAFPNGALFQPVYLGDRDDLNTADCRLTQLKYRSPEEDDEL